MARLIPGKPCKIEKRPGGYLYCKECRQMGPEAYKQDMLKACKHAKPDPDAEDDFIEGVCGGCPIV